MPNEAIPASVWREDAQDLRDNCFFPNTDRLDRLVHVCEKLAALAEHEAKEPVRSPDALLRWSPAQIDDGLGAWVIQRERLVDDLLRGPTP